METTIVNLENPDCSGDSQHDGKKLLQREILKVSTSYVRFVYDRCFFCFKFKSANKSFCSLLLFIFIIRYERVNKVFTSAFESVSSSGRNSRIKRTYIIDDDVRTVRVHGLDQVEALRAPMDPCSRQRLSYTINALDMAG